MTTSTPAPSSAGSVSDLGSSGPERPAQPSCVRQARRSPGVDVLDPEALARGSVAASRDLLRHEPREVDRLDVAGTPARDVDQVADRHDHVIEPRRCPHDAVDRGLHVRGQVAAVLEQQVDMAQHRRERRPQVVVDGRGELAHGFSSSERLGLAPARWCLAACGGQEQGTTEGPVG